LVEFAIIALVLYFLLAATLEFGRAFYANQTIQQAVDIAARELSRTPLPPTATFKDALADRQVRRRIFDKHYLVIDLDNIGGDELMTFVGKLPVVNQQLYLLMVFENVEGKRLLRYPGALLSDNDASDNPDADMPPVSGYLVSIPIVDGLDPTTYRWAEVVEPIRAGEGRADPFHLLSKEGGIAGVRINYPFQAATLSAFPKQDKWPPDPTGFPIKADDGAVTPAGDPGGTLLPDSDPGSAGTYAGPYGLGRQLAFGKVVRPFRRVLTGQAIQRREVFE